MTPPPAGTAFRLALVLGDFNPEITGPMLRAAREHAESLGVEVRYVARVPGAFDCPLLVQRLLERDDVDAIATLGAVLAGDTGHDEVVAQQCARKLVDLSLEYRKPVTLGISGPRMSWEQATDRIEEYARRAVDAAVRLLRALDQLEAAEGEHPVELG